MGRCDFHLNLILCAAWCDPSHFSLPAVHNPPAKRHKIAERKEYTIFVRGWKFGANKRAGVIDAFSLATGGEIIWPSDGSRGLDYCSRFISSRARSLWPSGTLMEKRSAEAAWCLPAGFAPDPNEASGRKVRAGNKSSHELFFQEMFAWRVRRPK